MYMFLKRVLDIMAVLCLLSIFLPLMIVLSFLLLFFNRGKVFFIQKRPGRNGKPFNIIKFKTMNDNTDNNGLPLPDEDRLHLPGMIVRKTSLDELPQLINVLKGDMSLIGPRPLLMEYLPLYNQEQARRHEVRPGITGWAQVNGRNAISWEEKFKLDVWYVENVSLSLDIKILWLTLLKVLKREGVNKAGHATTEKFTGSGI